MTRVRAPESVDAGAELQEVAGGIMDKIGGGI